MKDEQVQVPEASPDEEIRKLVLARLSILSPDKYVSIGSDGTFSRDDLISHVEAGDDVGKKIEEIELEWMRSWKEHVGV